MIKYFKIYKIIKIYIYKLLDIHFDTRIKFYFPKIIYSFVNVNFLDITKIPYDIAEYFVQMYLFHRFNVLGSGWVKSDYNALSLGFEGNLYNNICLFTGIFFG